MNTLWPHYRAARTATHLLEGAGFEAYIIGGAVRDILLGHTPKDFDLVTNATPDEITAIADFKQSHYKDTAQAFGVTRVVVAFEENNNAHEYELEIATYRRDIEAHLGRTQTKVEFAHLEDDVWRRDFTINALALNPDTHQVIDLVSGINDIENHTLRFIGEPGVRIQEDPLRILRGIRLKHQLGFTYTPETKEALQDAIRNGTLADIAPERIKQELTHMLMHPSRYEVLKELHNFTALEQIIPELTMTIGVAQPPELHAEGDVFTHSLLSMFHLPDIISPRLAWATLLHDIGKAETQTHPKTEADRIRFSDHHAVGATTARKILARLGFGNRFIQDVAWMIHYHLAIDDLPEMRPRRAQQFMHHPAFPDLLELHKADAHAAWNKSIDGSIDTGPADFSHIEAMWADYQKQRTTHPPSLKHDLGIDGGWLIDKFELSTGPEIGTILNILEDKYLNHQIHTPEEATRIVKDFLSSHRSS